MPIITLQPGEERNVSTQAKYLSIINSTGQFKIESPAFGEVAGKLGRQYVLDNVPAVTFINPASDALEIEFEIANIQIFGSGSGAVSIENKPIIRRIEEAIQVEAQATVDDGRMRMIQSNVLLPISLITIIPGQAKQFIAARDVTNRRVTLQVVSDTRTVLHIGNDATIDASKGAIVAGSSAAIGTATIENTAAIWLYNASNDTAKVTGIEEYRP